jgi:hypothetical protein
LINEQAQISPYDPEQNKCFSDLDYRIPESLLKMKSTFKTFDNAYAAQENAHAVAILKCGMNLETDD